MSASGKKAYSLMNAPAETPESPSTGTPPILWLSRAAGALYLGAFFAYGCGRGIVDSYLPKPAHHVSVDALHEIEANREPFLVGCLLIGLNSVMVIMIGALVKTIFDRGFSRNADGSDIIGLLYLLTRLGEATLLGFGCLCFLGISSVADSSTVQGESFHESGVVQLLTKLNFWGYQLGMLILALGSLPFFTFLYITDAIPKPLAVLGLVGYTSLGVGCVLEIFACGFHGVGVWLSLPGAAVEVGFSVQLLAYGLNIP